MTPEAYLFVAVVLCAVGAVCIAAGLLLQIIGAGRLGRWLRLDVRDDDR